jgi:hypothetical protein
VKRLFLGLGVLVVAGCGGGARVVAWTPARPVQPPVPPRGAPCQKRGLATSASFNGAGGQIVVNVAARNVGRHPCWLGTPSLRFAGGEPISVRRIPWYGDDPLTRAPRSSLRALRPGKTAMLLLAWWSTGTCPGKALRLVVRLPGSGATLGPGKFAPTTCAGGGAAVSMARWVPVPSLVHLPLRAEILGRRVNGRAVFHVRPNRVLRYEVALINVGRKPFRFAGCPVYVQELGRKDVRLLNCRSVPAIRPGGKVVFAMQLSVRGPVGWDNLSWYLPRANGDGVWDAAAVVVTG